MLIATPLVVILIWTSKRARPVGPAGGGEGVRGWGRVQGGCSKCSLPTRPTCSDSPSLDVLRPSPCLTHFHVLGRLRSSPGQSQAAGGTERRVQAFSQSRRGTESPAVCFMRSLLCAYYDVLPLA